MVAAELVDGHVSASQCKLAVEALLKHERQREQKLEESQLLPGKEQQVWLQITVKQMHPEKKLKPHKIPLAHPVVDPRTSPVCLITKDPQREYKDLLETNKIRFISRVVGVTKLKGKFKPFEARRLLLKENDLFLADERVIPLLPGLLGKKFFEAKKQPIPVCLTRKDLKGELERAISSTYFHQNQGTCSSIKVGTVSQSPVNVLANLKTALPAVVKVIKGGWDNIQSLHIKTNTSTSLPIWSCELGADVGGRWDGLVDQDRSGSEGEPEEEASAGEEELAEEVKKVAKGKKGKKRAAEDEEDQPKKKTKSSAADSPSKALKAGASPAVDGPTKSKKRKAMTDDESLPTPTSRIVTDPAASESTAAPPKAKERKKRGDKSAQPEPSSSSAATTATMTTRSASKQARAQATDFFEDNDASSALVPPPNTPAAGLKAVTPPPKKKQKAAKQTPVSGAISKLTEAKTPSVLTPSSEEPATHASSGDKPTKKAKRGHPAPAAADAKVPDEDTGEKKLKKKAKEVDTDAAIETPAAAAVSVQDVKRKVGAPSLERKKGKTLKAKRSAKEALIGKKGL